MNYEGPERRNPDRGYDYHGPERRHHAGNGGVDVNTWFGSFRLWGKWGAVLSLCAAAVIAVSGAVSYGVWTATTDFHAGLMAMSSEHREVLGALQALVNAQNQTVWETAQAKCTLFLPQDERDKARQYADVCKYASDVYRPKPGGPQIIVVPIPAQPLSPPNSFPTSPPRLPAR